MWFKIVDEIRDIETIAVGRSVRETSRLRKIHGGRRWRKLKGFARVQLPDGSIALAEIHWFESHGVGRRELKIKRLLD